MIATRTTNAQSPATSASPCGCSDGDPSSCTLACNEKPRFSCGQLLTDQDLTSLVMWSETKSGLARFRHGWGVVCGLDVHCNGQDGQVIVGSGYALDPCGRDVVMCSDTTVSLDACCKPQPAPCAGVVNPPPPVAEAEFGGIMTENVRLFDLILHYDEIDGSPRAALGGVNCAAGSRCEYSRTQETSRVECVPGIADSDPFRTQAEHWEEGYRTCLDVVRRFREESEKAKGGDIQQWLLRWIQRNPLRQFNFVSDWIRRVPAQDWNERLAVLALFWMVQDCRNAHLAPGCPRSQTAAGVPIARLLVQMPKPGATQAKCRVIAIDEQPPYRRYIHSDAWPAPMGHINAGRVIWQRVEEAVGILHRLGMRTDADGFTLPPTTKALETELDEGKVMISSGSVGKLQVLDCGNLGDRVVGVR